MLSCCSGVEIEVSSYRRPPVAPPVKVHVPDVFDGTDPHQLHHFLLQCHLYFRSGPTLFKSDVDKVNFAITYVSGVVQDQLQVALEQEDQGIHYAWLYSWSLSYSGNMIII